MLLYAGSILVSVLGFVGFIQSLRWAQLRGADTFVVAAINYCLAALIFFVWFFQASVPVVTSVAISGVMCGSLYAGGFFLLLYCMHWVGVGRTATTINLAPAMPIIISVFVWNETPTLLTTIGLVIAVISIPLIVMSDSDEKKKRLHVIGMIALAGLFCAEGFINTIFKWFEMLCQPQQKPIFLAAVFLTAGVITSVIVLRRGKKIRKVDLMHGTITGMLNVITNIMFLHCLTLAAAGIVFTTITVSTLVLTVVTSVLLWRERYPRKTVLGIILAVVAVLLINL